MNRLHLVSIVGARPNFIKLAALSPELRKVADETIVHTGQHYDYQMSMGFFDELGIPAPDYHLESLHGSHGEQTGDIMTHLDNVLRDESPDGVVVFGDTDSTLAGALCAAKMHIPVVHIESGARSYDMRMPEEINRVVVDHISDLLFCSTGADYMNLSNEGIPVTKIRCRGDVMVDLMDINKEEPVKTPKEYNLLTTHREENSNEPILREILSALDETGEQFVFPCHPRLDSLLQKIKVADTIHCIQPVGYWKMRYLETHAKRIVTDSGGVQKEAYILKKPCITLRENTEWGDTQRGAWNQLVGSDKEAIKTAFQTSPIDSMYRNGLFGFPGSCRVIAKIISEELHG